MSELTNAEQHEIQSLVDDMLEHGLDEAQATRLESILSDASAAEFYARYFELVADLAWRCRVSRVSILTENGLPAAAFERNRPARVTSRRWLYLAATAACVLLAIGMTFMRPMRIVPQNKVGNEAGETGRLVKRDWLVGARIQRVGDTETQWLFTDANVTITSSDALPEDICAELLGPDETARSITAAWRVDGKTLYLFDIRVDGEARENQASISLEQAGAVRINLGEQQYNVLRSASPE